MKRLVVLLVASAASVALAAGALPAQAAGQHARSGQTQMVKPTRVVANCNRLAVKPRRVVVTCADFGIFVVFRQYSSWTSTAALGSGIYRINDCKPSCVAGTVHRYQAQLRLGQVVKTKQGPVFSHLQVRYMKKGTMHRVGYALPTSLMG
jgi:hypothetical protein